MWVGGGDSLFENDVDVGLHNELADRGRCGFEPLITQVLHSGQRTLPEVETVEPDHDRRRWEPGNPAVDRWEFSGWSDGCGLGVWVEVAWRADRGTASYIAVVTPLEGPVVLVVDGQIPMVVPTPSLEFRAEGIWAQHVCETPLEHWSVGLEAFGVTLDDPSDAAGRQWGIRTPVGLDLEWEATGPPDDARAGVGFDQPCRVTGEILVGSDSFDVDGCGTRGRCWGGRPDPDEAPSEGLVVPVAVRGDDLVEMVTLVLGPDGLWTRSG